jgi:hypothetical protein
MKLGLAALAYWAMVFALGFVLGTVRVLLLAPAVGLVAATAIELPVMLVASWWAARWLVRRRFAIARASAALAMGALAFTLLIVAELLLAVMLIGQQPAEWLAGFRALHAQMGLAGQVLFALMPWLVVRREAMSA